MNGGESMKQDKIIQCQDCHQEFVWTVGEQEFYEEKGLPEPKYCLICRGGLWQVWEESGVSV